MAATVAELIDRGVKAYLAGRVKEALAAFQAVLALDPGNAKARGYIVRIHAVTPASTPLPGTHRPVTPAPGAARPDAAPRPRAAGPRARAGVRAVAVGRRPGHRGDLRRRAGRRPGSRRRLGEVGTPAARPRTGLRPRRPSGGRDEVGPGSPPRGSCSRSGTSPDPSSSSRRSSRWSRTTPRRASTSRRTRRPSSRCTSRSSARSRRAAPRGSGPRRSSG